MSLNQLLETNKYERSEYPVINQLIRAKQKQNRDDYERFKALDIESQNDIRQIRHEDIGYLTLDNVINNNDYKNDKNRQFTYLHSPLSELQIKRERDKYISDTKAPKILIKKQPDLKNVSNKLKMATETQIKKNYKNPNDIYGKQHNYIPEIYGAKTVPVYNPYNPFDRNSSTLSQDDLIALMS